MTRALGRAYGLMVHHTHCVIGGLRTTTSLWLLLCCRYCRTRNISSEFHLPADDFVPCNVHPANTRRCCDSHIVFFTDQRIRVSSALDRTELHRVRDNTITYRCRYFRHTTTLCCYCGARGRRDLWLYESFRVRFKMRNTEKPDSVPRPCYNSGLYVNACFWFFFFYRTLIYQHWQV